MDQLDLAVHRITKQFIKYGLYDNPLPWNFHGNVTSEEHQKFALKGVEESTVLLKNDATLPLDKTGGNMFLVLGDAASYPVVAGGGSGAVHYTDLVPPIWALCDELDIPRENFPLDTIVSYGCNKDKSNCIAYVGVIHSTTLTMDNEVAELDDKNLIVLEAIQEMNFNATLIFGGIFSSEGGDRSTLGWKSAVLDSLDKFQNKGKIIGAITAPGPALLKDIKEAVDALLFNIMPGQQYSDGLMSIIFGKANPSAKLSFTMPNIDNE
jgi:beta-glucosidase